MHAIVWGWMVLGCGVTEPAEAPAPEPAPAAEEPTPEPAPARRVFFRSPADGATVTSPFTIEFGVEGMGVHPAGEPVDGTGHHHLVIGPAGIPEGNVVPSDDKHIHYGGGQTEAELTLEPGEYTLTMQFADGLHQSYGESMAASIHVTVTE